MEETLLPSTWLRTGDAARDRVSGQSFGNVDKAHDEAPDEVFGTRKGKDFGWEEKNIEHRTFNIERRSSEARKEKFGTKFETKFQVWGSGGVAKN